MAVVRIGRYLGALLVHHITDTIGGQMGSRWTTWKRKSEQKPKLPADVQKYRQEARINSRREAGC